VERTVELDVTIIGGGPGGYVAAIRAAQLGGRIVLVEKDEVGGTCLNRGCIPTKALMTTAELFYTIGRSKEYGVSVDRASLDLKAVIERKNKVVKTLVDGTHSLLKGNTVELIRGTGSIVDRGEVEVSEKDEGKSRVKSKNIIVATGSRTIDKSSFGFEQREVITTDDALEIGELPRSMLVVGGGPSGVEFANIYKMMGVDVTVIEMLSQILPGEDMELASQLRYALEKNGIKVVTNAKFKDIITEKGEKKAVFTTEKGDEKVPAEKVLVAFGRVPNSDNIGLEKVNVKVEKRRVLVDERMQTSTPNVYAIGDVIGGMYAHVASAEGVVAAENIFGMKSSMNYKVVPRCIFTMPEVAAVGLTEKQARECGQGVKIGRFSFASSGRALTLGDSVGLIKLVVSEKTGEILGIHMIGPRVTDLIAEATLAMSLECTVDEIADTIHAHPTLAEAFREAALDVKGEAVHKVRRRKIS